MASNVKLIDIGTVNVELKHEMGEWVLYYTDPDQPPGITARFGGGLKKRRPLDVQSALARDLRSRGYTGKIVNTRPALIRRGGVKA